MINVRFYVDTISDTLSKTEKHYCNIEYSNIQTGKLILHKFNNLCFIINGLSASQNNIIIGSEQLFMHAGFARIWLDKRTLI